MNFFHQIQGFFQPHKYDMNVVQNPYFHQRNYTPGFYRETDETLNKYPLQWNNQQQMQNYQSFAEPNENYYAGNSNCYQSFDGNIQGSNNKRAREFYSDDDYNSGSNPAKKQKLSAPSSVQYALKKFSEYANPMRKALDLLFATEITADGWEKINNQFRYHTAIRGKRYSQWGSSIDTARENVAENALKNLAGFKMQQISWPPQLLSFRLEQHLADSIEKMVKSKLDEIMQSEPQHKSYKVRSGIVMTHGTSLNDARVVAIGTGTKCFADKHEDKDGAALHDMHAEVMVRRSFVHFLYNQLLAMKDKKPSIFILNGEDIQLKDDLKFHLYVNTIPCGDARVFSLKGCAQLKKAARQGTLRTKKIGGTDNLSETDSHRVKSMSCSDKIARWNVLGLQGAALAKYIEPIYLESIVLGSSYVPIHLHRAIFGRLENSLVADLSAAGGYRLNKPKFESTFVMETMNFASTEDYGVCWSEGFNPEIIDLNTGLQKNGNESQVSKVSLSKLFQSISEKHTNGSDAGIDKYNEVKKMFYDALKARNFGVWDIKFN